MQNSHGPFTNSTEIEKYLLDPFSHGVRLARLSIGTDAVANFISEIRKNAPPDLIESVTEEIRPRKRLRARQPEEVWEVNDLGQLDVIMKAVMDRISAKNSDELARRIIPLLDLCCYLNDLGTFTGLLNDLSSRQYLPPSSATILRMALRRIVRGYYGIFDPEMSIPSIQQALHLEHGVEENRFVVQICSVNGEPINIYQDLLSKIFGSDSVRLMLNEKRYSTRMVFQPFLSAVYSWVHAPSSRKIIPNYLVNYLNAADSYHRKGEYLTSVVLANIALETLIAELWEEVFHSEAPDIPIGALKDDFEKRKPKFFPREIVDWIMKSNSARIKAVHRGKGQPSAQDSLDSIRGVAKVALWHFLSPKCRVPQLMSMFVDRVYVHPRTLVLDLLLNNAL